MGKEAVKDRITDIRKDVETKLTIDKDKITDFEESLGIKDLQVEAEDGLTKVLMYHNPMLRAGPQIRMTNGVFTVRRLDTLLIGVTRKPEIVGLQPRKMN